MKHLHLLLVFLATSCAASPIFIPSLNGFGTNTTFYGTFVVKDGVITLFAPGNQPPYIEFQRTGPNYGTNWLINHGDHMSFDMGGDSSDNSEPAFYTNRVTALNFLLSRDSGLTYIGVADTNQLVLTTNATLSSSGAYSMTNSAGWSIDYSGLFARQTFWNGAKTASGTIGIDSSGFFASSSAGIFRIVVGTQVQLPFVSSILQVDGVGNITPATSATFSGTVTALRTISGTNTYVGSIAIAPANAVTVAGWMPITNGTTRYYVPLYQ